MNYITIPASYSNGIVTPFEEIDIVPVRTTITFEYEEENLDTKEDMKNIQIGLEQSNKGETKQFNSTFIKNLKNNVAKKISHNKLA